MEAQHLPVHEADLENFQTKPSILYVSFSARIMMSFMYTGVIMKEREIMMR